ncbi:uncharacterized protein MONBRDRAFT_33884 [Monosiga brevicollis MX1]|uniref:Protein farnesyltransferase subunit beta n=1 Tax=Monosiga brevicollis TaxID=81824 RepID=A9V860_MONBE|nr:uncharacterized protein MONBRDRAFT_33884 [Monosiga brevicollis MX1]EDQ86216.1 predicted protein [Monosiga brevicollis MX1]|eukprot:XP_001748886.1 hypothetical protein [Monosiga brevicollis MX1]
MALLVPLDAWGALTINDDGLSTLTTRQQEAVETQLEDECFRPVLADPEVQPRLSLQSEWLMLDRRRHIGFLRSGLGQLGSGYQCLDASRPWIIYWCLHGLSLLGYEPNESERTRCINTLRQCQNATGGFGGGPGQLSHLAPTYASVNALAILGPDALSIIDRISLRKFLAARKRADGSFTMHEDGEVDIRGVYCATSAAFLACLPKLDELFAGSAAWIARCQTYEGGFAAVPGAEAHGGYAFCGLAALHLLQGAELIDLPRLASWAVERQMKFEGGFQGRTNKLVDGCYSFWVGGVFPLLRKMLKAQGADPGLLCSAEGLIHYVCICCQHPRGGLIDKPGKGRDFYHTCYCLSGLQAVGHPELIVSTHEAFNIASAKAKAAQEFFASQTAGSNL